MLIRVFSSKVDEVIRDWEKLHNEKFHNLYSLTNISRMTSQRGLCGQSMLHDWAEDEYDISARVNTKTVKKTET
jgi:hypothetical protein